MRVRPARVAVAAALLVGATACTAPPEGTAELVVGYSEAGSVTRVEVTLDDVACTSSETGMEIRSGRSEGARHGSPGVLVVIVSDASPSDVLSLELGDGRHFLSREAIEADDDGIRFEEHEGYVVSGYLTDDEAIVAEGATLTGTVTC